MADTKSIYERRFEAAVSVIQSLPKNGSFQPSNELMLKFYSYYKQATLGPCNTSRPGFWDPIGKYKWDAWNSLGDMSKEEAMIAYVDEMKKILESMPMTKEVEELLCVIGPFYELVDDKKQSISPYVISSAYLSNVSPAVLLSASCANCTGRLEKVVKSLEDLGNVLSSPKNCNKMNGKVESNDSGAESEQGEDNGEVTDNDLDDEVETNEVVKLRTVTQEPADVKLEDVKPESVIIQKTELLSTNVHNGLPDPQPALKPGTGEKEKDVMVYNIQQLAMNGEIDGLESQDGEHSGTQHLASDSDSEVYCDSMEQLGSEEILVADCTGSNDFNSSQMTSEFEHSQLLSNQSSCKSELECSMKSHQNPGIIRPADLGKGGVTHGGEETRSSGSGPQKDKVISKRPESHMLRRGQGNRIQQSAEGFQPAQWGSGDDEERRGSEQIQKGNINEQIAIAVIRLQEDMQSVLERLHILEAAAATQAKSENAQHDSAHSGRVKGSTWWPFDVSGTTIAFAVLWPFIVQLLVHFYFQRRKRKLK